MNHAHDNPQHERGRRKKCAPKVNTQRKGENKKERKLVNIDTTGLEPVNVRFAI